MKRNLTYCWILSEFDQMAIQLFHPDMYFWIAFDHNEERVMVVGVYDVGSQICRQVNYFRPHDVYYGEVRPLIVNDEEVIVGEPRSVTWMDDITKERLLELMRKAISFRKDYPLPPFAKAIWRQADEVVRNLDIINPGRSRYIG